MYAIIETGSKQYLVNKGDTIDVELLQVEPGKKVNIENVLLISDNGHVEIGRPYIKNAKVVAEVVELFKGKKQVIFKYKNKTRYHRKTGHRQQLLRLKIEDIKLGKD
ncbi:MAG: 50S ribosomal protein L21 [Candidatus Saganbacteria bacterium]|nr:50S ribosomal protein L21 [Candidatus Saganbacteria bacterium]